ncbi:ferritin [bacterium]|nr:ferritin [bacterium]
MYLSMAAYCTRENLPGCASWMTAQAHEEFGHMMKIYNYVLERGGAVTLSAIEAPPAKWAGPARLFEDVLKHERAVSKMIDKLVDLAIKEKDHATNNFLQWFVSEQVEEEATADMVLQKFKMVQDAPSGLYLIDRELAQRGQRAPFAPSSGPAAT